GRRRRAEPLRARRTGNTRPGQPDEFPAAVTRHRFSPSPLPATPDASAAAPCGRYCSKLSILGRPSLPVPSGATAPLVPVVRLVMAKGQVRTTTNKAWRTTFGIAIAIVAATLTAEAQRRAPAHMTVPAGTILDVRLTQPVDADYATPGATSHAILDYPV